MTNLKLALADPPMPATLDAGMPRKGRAFGNVEVCEMLKRWLARAEEGRINYMALVAMEGHNTALMDYIGSVQMEAAAPWACEQMKAKIEQIIESRQTPTADPSLDASYVCYNCR